MPDNNMKVKISKEVLEEFITYLYERENAKATIQKYKKDVQVFLKFLDGKRLIGKKELIEYKEWLKEEYAVTSVNSMLAALNQFLIYLGAGRLKVKRLKQQRQLFLKEEKALSVKEYRRLVNAAKEKKDSRLVCILETICSTGIRISELPYFTVASLQRGRIEVWNKGKCRIILIPEALKMKLICYSKKNKIQKGPVFITRNGKAVDRSNIWMQMKELHEKADVDETKIFPHNLRHLFAKTYYCLTRDLNGLAALLGHSNIEVTRIYAADTANIYQKTIDKMKLII